MSSLELGQKVLHARASSVGRALTTPAGMRFPAAQSFRCCSQAVRSCLSVPAVLAAALDRCEFRVGPVNSSLRAQQFLEIAYLCCNPTDLERWMSERAA